MRRKYYEAELSHLRQEGREFARLHPSVAGLLSERGSDPDVERLLEGVAFIAGRIRERIDDSIPELAQAYASILVPHLTAFAPPSAIVQYHPERGAVREPKALARGAEVAAARSGLRCSFRTTAPVRLLPLELLDVRTERRSATQSRIVLRMQTAPEFGPDLAHERLRLFFHGGLGFWTTLRAWFVHHCTQMEVYARDQSLAVIGDPEISGVGMGEAERLLPANPLEHDALTVAYEAFAAPERFAFVDLPPLGVGVPADFSLAFEFQGAPDLLKPAILGDIRLHCVPVVNLFEVSAEPVRFDLARPEQRLRPAGYAPSDAEVWGVTKVVGLGSELEYPPFARFDGRRDSRFYALRRTRSDITLGSDLHLAIQTPHDCAPVLDNEVLMVDLLCSNRGVAAGLEPGKVCLSSQRTGTSVPFSNITTVTGPRAATDNDELVWRLTAHLGVSRHGLRSAASLRRLLSAYVDTSHDSGKSAGLWIDAISDVRTTSRVRVTRGAPVTGSKTEIVLDTSRFAAVGEAILFGHILDEVYARRCPINTFSQLSIELSPTGAQYTWPARNATMRL